MHILAAIGLAAAVVWSIVFARRASLLATCTLVVAAGYVLPHAFWHASTGVATLTIDRLGVLGICALLVWHWRTGRLPARSLAVSDWILAALLGYLTLRCAITAPAPEFRPSVGPWWRVIAAFWMPAILYLAARVGVLDVRRWLGLLLGIAGLGTYLALTGLAEVTGQWWAVFPRFIANPELGTHFGRARGPALMSASMGVFLTVGFWAAWIAWPRASRLVRGTLLIAMPAMVAGVYFTYTRSTWLGMIGCAAVIPLLQLPKRQRIAAAAGAVVLGTVGLIAVGPHLLNLTRKDTDGSSSHSVYQRAAFAHVSLRMFQENPLFGCGVSRFYDRKLPYLAERGEYELESIRNLEHHNTLLSILVETGLTGFALFVALIGAWMKSAWDLVRWQPAGSWQRAHGLFSAGVIIAYLTTALFHDLTLSPTEHWLLFLCAGVSVALSTRRQVAADAVVSGNSWNLRRKPPRPAVSAVVSAAVSTPTTTISTPGRVALFGMQIDPVRLPTAVERVLRWCAVPRDGRCRYVVTPNVDHAVMYQTDGTLRQSYADASLVLADGAPVVWAARLLQQAVPERVAGSDLTPALFRRASQSRHPGQSPQRALRVFLLGAAPGVAERAKQNIETRWRGVQVVGTLSPPLGFEHDPVENEKILAAVAAVEPDLVVIGLGAPKQEVWISQYADRLEAKVALCAGATIDFLAGERSRAPVWMQRVGLEWCHRLLTEPRRLARRYFRDGLIFPRLVYRDWRESRT
ncbi:WecB/TagA/CpsF family glycosyltransferase [Pirellulales bacterium]|nr:WecB/TagA/CpsF family glycosyltransferase [Pirellulales bacterium]